MNTYLFKLALRNTIKHRLFFVISVLGLSVGVAASMLLIVYTHYESSYDNFHPQSENLYRINFHVSKEGKQLINSCRTPSALSWVLQDESDLIAASTRVLYEECYMYTDRVKLQGQHVLWADSSFLNVFQSTMIFGDRNEALANQYSVVISEEVSMKYFGNNDPLGKVIKLNEGIPFTVTGVFKSLPKNTHMHYDFVVSFKTLEVYGLRREGNWRSNYLSTYFRKQASVSEASVYTLLNSLSEKYLSAKYKNGEHFGYTLMPVNQIYLHSELSGEYHPQSSYSKIQVLFIIALLIIVIAWINNINIITALSFERTKESGIHKLLGAENFSFVKFYLSESFMLNAFSILISIIIFLILFPFYQNLIGVVISYHILMQPWIWGVFVLILMAGTLITGMITALIHSSVKPIDVLGKKIKGSLQFRTVRRILAISQFTLAIILIIATLVIKEQITYLQTRDIGMQTEQILVMRGPATNNTSGDKRYYQFCAFRQELLKSPYVENVTATMNIPGQPNRYQDVSVFKNGQKIDDAFNIAFADNNYFETYGVPLLAGRNFYPDINAEKNAVIINEKACKALGYVSISEAIGKRIMVRRSTMQIVGVVKNYHQESLQKNIEPYMYQFRHPHEFGYYPVLVATSNLKELNKYAHKVWNKYYPKAKADFFFLDKYFNRQYVGFEQLNSLIGISSLLAIFIACMGLFAFVVYTIEHKIKEIGIRKVNGAKVGEILALLNKDFIKWVIIAFVIATPVAYYAMTKWLENFAYKTELSWWIFALAGVVALGIALLTVSFQSWKAATRNPVEALRYE